MKVHPTWLALTEAATQLSRQERALNLLTAVPAPASGGTSGGKVTQTWVMVKGMAIGLLRGPMHC